MSILIKGMEMPKHCFNCSTKVDPDNRRCNIDGHVFEETLGKLTCRRDDACPLIEIPPHGRLIDADALTKMCREMESIEWNNKAAPYSWAYAYESFEGDIDNASTIIEAEGGE